MGNQGGLHKPRTKLTVSNHPWLRCLVDTPLGSFLKDVPVNERAKHAPGRPRHCLAFAKLFPHTPLYLRRGGSTLQPEQPPDHLSYEAPKRVHGHGHAPMDSQAIPGRQSLQKMKSIIPERYEVRRDVGPYPH